MPQKPELKSFFTGLNLDVRKNGLEPSSLSWHHQQPAFLFFSGWVAYTHLKDKNDAKDANMMQVIVFYIFNKHPKWIQKLLDLFQNISSVSN